MSARPYRVGETVLMNYQGWLKAFTVVSANATLTAEGQEAVEYTLAMVEQAEWRKPARSGE